MLPRVPIRRCGTLRVLVGIILLIANGLANAETVWLRFARIVDGTGDVLPGREIVVDNGLIAAVGNDLLARHPGAVQIYLDTLTAVPGFIDVHVHMTYALHEPAHGNAWNELFATPAAQRLVGAARNARLTLQTGVTTVRDLFAFDGVDRNLKALIDAGVVPGPRMYLAGEAIHPLTLPAPDAETGLVQRLADKTRQQIDAGVDWIKIFATTGSADDLSGRLNYGFAEIDAVARIAHAAGLRVAVHSYGPAAVEAALRAGVDSIEHAVGVDDALLARWAATGTVYVPTIDHNRYYADHRGEYGYDTQVERDLQAFVEANVDTLRRAHRAGVRVALGSDAVMTMFGQNTRELEWFAAAGMSPAAVLRAATVNGAALLGEEEFLGRLRPGYAADILAVQGDPLSDVTVLTRHVVWVMKGGQMYVAGKRD